MSGSSSVIVLSDVNESERFVQIEFQGLEKSYEIGSVIQCSFNLGRGIKPTERDCIALFQIGWMDVTEYICVLPVAAEGKIELRTSGLELSELSYQLCYLTSGNFVVGCSKPFKFFKPIKSIPKPSVRVMSTDNLTREIKERMERMQLEWDYLPVTNSNSNESSTNSSANIAMNFNSTDAVSERESVMPDRYHESRSPRNVFMNDASKDNPPEEDGNAPLNEFGLQNGQNDSCKKCMQTKHKNEMTSSNLSLIETLVERIRKCGETEAALKEENGELKGKFSSLEILYKNELGKNSLMESAMEKNKETITALLDMIEVLKKQNIKGRKDSEMMKKERDSARNEYSLLLQTMQDEEIAGAKRDKNTQIRMNERRAPSLPGTTSISDWTVVDGSGNLSQRDRGLTKGKPPVGRQQ